MPNTVLGKVSVTPKGAWSSSSSYEKLDIVSNGGNSYIALQDVPSGTALSNSSYWLMIAQKGDKGNTGEITGASASISGGYGTPSVSVTSGGTSTDRSFAFAFSNLKGNGISAVNCEKTGTSGAVDTYTLTISEDDGTVNTFALEVTNGSVTSVNGRTGAVEGLAEDNGYYDEMTVGGAEQLISSTYVEDSVPYVFRTSGGSADIGDREFDEIHGGTIAWNQQIEKPSTSISQTINGITITDNRDGTYTVSGTATADVTLIKVTNSLLQTYVGHIYLYCGCPTGGSTSTYYMRLGAGTQPKDTGNGALYKRIGSNNSFHMHIEVLNGTVISSPIVFKPVYFDLTQVFGSTIADYIYSLEQSNTGSGVAWFKSLFPKPYYAYNAGQLISVSGLSAHKMTGFNQWDADTLMPLAGFTKQTDGSWYSSNSALVAVGTVIWENKSGYTGRFYISCDYKYSSSTSSGARFKIRFKDGTQQQFVMSPSTTYAHFEVQSYSDRVVESINYDYGSGGIQTWMKNVCVNFAWDGERNGEYEPYEVRSYALDSDVTLRGIPKLDADNKLYYDGDVYASDGSVQRRFGIVDLGTLTWEAWTGYASVYRTSLPSNCKTMPNNNTLPNWIAPIYKTVIGTDIASNNKTIGQLHQTYLVVHDDSYSTASDFKTAMNGVMLVYELATPTTESAEPYTAIQQVSNWGTEEYVIAEQSGVALPVGHLTRYTQDLKAKLEMAPQSPSAGNGDYVVRQTNGINEYVKLVIPTELPTAPSSDGNYTLKCTVSGSTVTYTWEAQS